VVSRGKYGVEEFVKSRASVTTSGKSEYVVELLKIEDVLFRGKRGYDCAGNSEYVGLLVTEYEVPRGNVWYDRADFNIGFVTVSGKSEYPGALEIDRVLSRGNRWYDLFAFRTGLVTISGKSEYTGRLTIKSSSNPNIFFHFLSDVDRR
jgi:hypothetical protein